MFEKSFGVLKVVLKVVYKFREHHRRSVGFCNVPLIMLQKSSARKGFCAEDWRVLGEKWYMKHAEVAVL